MGKTKYTAIKSTNSLYFVAVVPPADICAEITQMKWQAKTLFNSSQSLKSPPHITLHMPFEWENEKEELVRQTIREVASLFCSFPVTIKEVGGFEPKVVFLEVKPHEGLVELHKTVAKSFRKLQLFNATYKDLPFYPHITVAFRDLKKALYLQTLSHFKSISFVREFNIESIDLLKHNGNGWEVHSRFPFSLPN